MKLSICTDVMGDLAFTDMLDKCVKLGVEGIEMTGGGWSQGPALPRRPPARRQGRAQGGAEGDRGPRPRDRRAQLLGQPARPRPDGRAPPQGDGGDRPPRRRDRRQDHRHHVRPAGRRARRQRAELARLHQELARRDARARPLPVGGLRLPVLGEDGEARRRGRRRELRARELQRHAGLEPRDPVPAARRRQPEDRHEPRPQPPDVDGRRPHRLGPRAEGRDPSLPRQGHPHRARPRRRQRPAGAEGRHRRRQPQPGTTSPSAPAATCSGGRSSSPSCG